MSTNGDPGQRVGNAERETAIAALNQHWQAGRLDPGEHERRTTAAYAAVTRGDLDALFTDLPGGDPVTSSTPAAPISGPQPGTSPAPLPPEPTPPATASSGSGGLFPADSWVGQHRDAVMGVTPFLALALFFITKQWWWFLLIPAMGAALYSGGDGRGRDRDRGRDR